MSILSEAASSVPRGVSQMVAYEVMGAAIYAHANQHAGPLDGDKPRTGENAIMATQDLQMLRWTATGSRGYARRFITTSGDTIVGKIPLAATDVVIRAENIASIMAEYAIIQYIQQTRNCASLLQYASAVTYRDRITAQSPSEGGPTVSILQEDMHRRQGQSMKDYMRTLQAANESEFWEVVVDLLSIIRVLWTDHQVAHGDLNMNNVIIQRDSAGNPVLRLIDYGWTQVVIRPDDCNGALYAVLKGQSIDSVCLEHGILQAMQRDHRHQFVDDSKDGRNGHATLPTVGMLDRETAIFFSNYVLLNHHYHRNSLTPFHDPTSVFHTRGTIAAEYTRATSDTLLSELQAWAGPDDRNSLYEVLFDPVFERLLSRSITATALYQYGWSGAFICANKQREQALLAAKQKGTEHFDKDQQQMQTEMRAHV